MIRMYSNGAIESTQFIEEPLSPANMRMYSNSNVEIINIVEVSGAQGKLHANGTYVCSKIIEVA